MASIGIYWVHRMGIIGRKENHYAAEEYLGVYDSNFDHYSSWQVTRAEYSDLREIKYDEIDRGRCVFLPRNAFHIVYCSRAVIASEATQKKIRFYFQVTGKCYFIPDDNYA